MIYVAALKHNLLKLHSLLSALNLQKDTKAPSIKLVALNELRFFDVNLPISKSIYIFTSAAAAREFAKPFMQAASVGEQTSKELIKHGAKVLISSPNNHADGLIDQILKSNYKSFIYLRAKNVACDIAKILRSNKLECEQIICYENALIKPKICAYSGAFNGLNIVILSSPSLTRALYLKLMPSKIFKNNLSLTKAKRFLNIKLNYHAICIGKSTNDCAKKLFISSQISAKTSLAGCLEELNNYKAPPPKNFKP